MGAVLLNGEVQIFLFFNFDALFARRKCCRVRADQLFLGAVLLRDKKLRLLIVDDCF